MSVETLVAPQIPATKTSPFLDRVPVVMPKLHVAMDVHRESKIGLWAVQYEGKPKSSVFVYPAEWLLTQELIRELDPNYGLCEKVISRKFRDLDMNALDLLFKQNVRAISDFDHEYTHPIHRFRVLEHSYHRADIRNYLRGVIQDLPEKKSAN